MKKGPKIAMIVMLVITIALVAAGVTGIIEKEKERQNVPSDWEQFQVLKEESLETAADFRQRAENGIENIKKYIEQIEKNKVALENSGAETIDIAATVDATKEALGQSISDEKLIGEIGEAVKKALQSETINTEDIDEELKNANKKLEAAEKEYNEKFLPQIDKLNDMLDAQEGDAEKIANALKLVSARLDNMKRSLRKITKVDILESASAPSAETYVRKRSEQVARLISKNNPDLDLGEQFKAESNIIAKKKTDDAEAQKTFTDTLKENFDYFLWLAGAALIATVLCFLGWRKPDSLRKIGKTANKNMMLVALVVITLFFFVMTRYKNLTPANIYNVINQYSYIIILATGMLLCIVSSANIDLSVGRVMGFIAACAAKFVIDGKMPVGLSMALCLLIGIAIGAWQGFWIAYVKIPAFVVTLAGQLTFYGLTMVLLKGETKAPFPENFNNVFGNAIPDFLGSGNGGLNVTALVIGAVVILAFIAIQLLGRANRVKKGYSVDPIGLTVGKIVTISAVLAWMFYSLAQNKGLPTILITVSLVLLIYTFLTSKTVIGRHLYAMGGNVNAARLSGVKTQRMLFLVYVNMGLLAALAGLAYAVRMNSASPMGGQSEELNAIAACYIGGASAYGGIGTVGGAVIGALTMGMIKNGMSMMGMNQDVQQVVLGLVLLLAVVIDIVSKSSGATSLPFLNKLHARKEKRAEAVAASKA